VRSSLAGCLLLMAACSRVPGPGVRSVVLLPFEDLRSTPGEPVAEALRIALAQSLEAQPSVMPMTPSHQRELSGIPATLLVDGYVAPDGFHLSVNAEPLVCKGTLDHCAATLAAQIATRAGASAATPPPADAALALAKARQAATEEDWRSAAEAFRSYGPVWIARVEHAASTNSARGLALISEANTSGWRPVDIARLDVLRAVLQRDKTKTAEAFERLAQIAPADFQTQQRAAAAAVEVRRFNAAIAIYERLLAPGPNPEVANEAAYAAAFSGDRRTAENFVARALQGAPADPRFLDTAGDVAYYFGDYAAAARSYAAANGIDKAAEAFALAGDRASAEAMLAKQTDDGLTKALWLWRTKQRDAALAELEKSSHPRAPFFLALSKLHARDFAGARTLRQRVSPSTVEFVILSALIDAPPANAGEGMHALHAFVRGDKQKCLAQIALAKARVHPFADSSLRRIEAAVKGEMSNGFIPSALDDWLAFLAV